MDRPFEAYRGDGPFTFVCYSHEDTAKVFPEIQRLHEGGVNVYYDEGISPGEEWTQELADAIDGSSRLLYFVSPASVASRHCRNEIQYALDQEKSVVSVFLEPTELPGGLKLTLGLAQAILKFELDLDEYEQKLSRAFGLSPLSPGNLKHSNLTAPSRNRRPWGVAAIVSGAAVSGLMLWLVTTPPTERPLVDRSLAVLPFSVLGADAGAATYAGALTEELRAAVADYQELRTVAVRDEVDPYGFDGASYVLGGNVQRLAESVRLRAHLTRSDDRHTVWAQTFEHPVTSGTPDAAEMATTVGRFVRLQLVVDQGCESVRRTTRSQEAAAAYCAALTDSYRGAQIGTPDHHLALTQAQRAVALDPDIADAHVQVGLNSVWLGGADQMDWRDAAKLARAALDRSLVLAPDDAQALGLQGRIEQLEMNYPAAEASFLESAARDPLLPRANLIHGRLGQVALAQGRLDEALEHFRRALRVDDSNAVQHMTYAGALWSTGEYREAIPAADAGLSLVESGITHAYLYVIKVAAHDALGERSQANAVLDEALAFVGSESKPVLAVALASLGRTEEAREILTALEGLEQPPITWMAETYAALGDARAFDWIHTGIDRHIIWVTQTLRASPVYSELRADPRWAEVMAHLEAEEAIGRSRDVSSE